MDDPIQRHPTRAEQLDIMASAISDLARPGDRVLDLGCGTGFFIHLLSGKRRDLAITGVDVAAGALEAAQGRFGEDEFDWVVGDLSDPGGIRLPHATYRFVTSGLVFHDLSDAQKKKIIGQVASWLDDDGFFLLYDRIRLTEAALFPLQAAIWRRLERVHGFTMRAAEDFPAYERDLDGKNMPGRLDDYQGWFEAAGLAHGILHLHGNIAVMAATRRG